MRRGCRSPAARGRTVARLKIPPEAWTADRGDAIRAAADETVAAIGRGEDVIYQACFFDGRWLVQDGLVLTAVSLPR